MNALTLIKQDHRNVEDLFKKFEAAGESADAEKRTLRDKIVEQLSVHAAVEEQVLYPALREELPDTEQDVLEALEEHHAAKLALAELEKLDPTHERFTAKMTVLIESVRHHIEEEEESLFPTIREAFGTTRLEELGDALEKAKVGAPPRPHPFQPDEPPLNVLLGAPVAILDRVLKTGREAVTGLLKRAG